MSVSKFKTRYDNDAEFREAHLAYVKTLVKCKGCGREVTRCNLVRHTKSNLHKKNLINPTDATELEIYRKEIVRKHNKKIRLLKRQHKLELKKIDKKIKKKKGKK